MSPFPAAAVWPYVPREDDVRQIAAHISAAAFRPDPDQEFSVSGWKMQCPACGGWDFGATATLREAVLWLHGGYLPPAPLLGGACLECEHATSPPGRELPDPEDLEMPLRRPR